MQPTSIGPFKIQRELGRGGMGQVFLARDSRLDRLVAIKALPEATAQDPDALARFEREARMLASLNHPGIGAIYGLEEVGGQRYLILEFIDGETLRRRMSRGGFPIDQALSIAQRIAEALEAAHDKGIIHRDLKPGNVMITTDGVVKVLDFGLARPEDPPYVASPDMPNSSTPDSRGRNLSPTIPGVILGSPGYMSPEQALGKAVDKRSDIFAFGCVLYEMLTGEQAFPGENVTASLGAVLHLEPDWSRLPENTPARIRELLIRATTKERRQRLHDIGDARLTLERSLNAREWEAAAGDAGSGRAGNPLARLLPWILAAAALAVAAVGAWRSSKGIEPTTAAPGAIVRLRADDADAPLTATTDVPAMAISADGRQIVYPVTVEGGGCMAVRRLDDFSFDIFPRFASDIFFAPDGKLVFSDSGALFVRPAGGGQHVFLYEERRNIASKGCAWSPRGILFARAPNSGLFLVPASGGEPRELTVPDAARNEVSHRWPDVLPDGRRALITIKKFDTLTFDDAEIALLDLDTGTWKTIIRGGSFARYARTGHIVYVRNASIMAVPFDVESGEVTGSPVTVVSGVMWSPGSGAAKFAFARDAGTLVYTPGGSDEERNELVWIDMTGHVEPVGAPAMRYFHSTVSPDGTRIATSVFGASDAIFVYDLVRRTNTRITFRGNCSDARWMPDGKRIAYVSDADGPTAGYLINADGSGLPEKIAERSARGGRRIAMVDGQPVTVFEEGGDILLQPFHSESRQKLVATQFDEIVPQVSPDGRWLSYASNETGQFAVYVRPFPSGEGRWQVFAGDTYHCWAPDSSAIYCADYDNLRFLRVPFRAEPDGVEVGPPEVLFTLPPDIGFQPTMDPSGTRFLSSRGLPRQFQGEQVCVVLNWFDELKAKVPGGSN